MFRLKHLRFICFMIKFDPWSFLVVGTVCYYVLGFRISVVMFFLYKDRNNCIVSGTSTGIVDITQINILIYFMNVKVYAVLMCTTNL